MAFNTTNYTHVLQTRTRMHADTNMHASTPQGQARESDNIYGGV